MTSTAEPLVDTRDAFLYGLQGFNWAHESIADAEDACSTSTRLSRRRRQAREMADRLRLRAALVIVTALPFALAGLGRFL